jgi:hypothetical protein
MTLSSGTISHTTGAGYNHVPSGGSSGQYLGWSSSGVAMWTAAPAIGKFNKNVAFIGFASEGDTAKTVDYCVGDGFSTLPSAIYTAIASHATKIYITWIGQTSQSYSQPFIAIPSTKPNSLIDFNNGEFTLDNSTNANLYFASIDTTNICDMHTIYNFKITFLYKTLYPRQSFMLLYGGILNLINCSIYITKDNSLAYEEEFSLFKFSATASVNVVNSCISFSINVIKTNSIAFMYIVANIVGNSNLPTAHFNNCIIHINPMNLNATYKCVVYSIMFEEQVDQKNKSFQIPILLIDGCTICVDGGISNSVHIGKIYLVSGSSDLYIMTSSMPNTVVVSTVYNVVVTIDSKVITKPYGPISTN